MKVHYSPKTWTNQYKEMYINQGDFIWVSAGL